MKNKKWPDLRCPKCLKKTVLNKIYKGKPMYVCKNENCSMSTYHAVGGDRNEYNDAKQIESKISKNIDDYIFKAAELRAELTNIEISINNVKRVPNLQFDLLKSRLK